MHGKGILYQFLTYVAKIYSYIKRLGMPDLTPNLKYLKSFFKCLAKEQKGLITSNISVQTLDHLASDFGTVYKSYHGIDLTDAITALRIVGNP